MAYDSTHYKPQSQELVGVLGQKDENWVEIHRPSGGLDLDQKGGLSTHWPFLKSLGWKMLLVIFLTFKKQVSHPGPFQVLMQAPGPVPLLPTSALPA